MKHESWEIFKIYAPLCTLIWLACVFLMPETGHVGDNAIWVHWCSYIFAHGLGHVYESGTDYPPLFHYLLWFFGKIQGSPEAIIAHIRFFRLITLCFHFISGFVLVKLMLKAGRSIEKAVLLSFFYLLNIAVLYNTLIWGQLDAILTSLVFLSFYFAWKKRITPSLILLVLALNFKIQAIIFVPVIGLVLLPVAVESFSIKKLGSWVSAPLTVQLLILIPFISTGQVGEIGRVIVESFSKYPFVNMNAFNVWELVVPGHPGEILDKEIVAGLSYKTWGLLAFFTSSFVALFPLLRAVWGGIFGGEKRNFPAENILLIGALIPLLFFFLNTQMHERYAHPALVFLIGYALISRNYGPAILGSIAYLLNLDSVFRVLEFQNYGVFIFNKEFIAILFLATIIWLYVLLYRRGWSD